MNSQEFYNELKHLTELGYLEQEQLCRIQQEYIKTRKEHRSIFLIFALLGVIFIGAGVISLFAYNWSMFSREMKAFIALLPLLGVQGILYWKIRSNASDIWIKSLTLALGIAFLSALGLIYQAYQISCSLNSMMLTGFLLMLPVIYLLDGYYLAILYMAGIYWAGGNNGYILLALLLLPYYVQQVKKKECCWQLSLCFFIWLPCLAMIYIPYDFFFACIIILFLYMTIETPAFYQKLAGRVLYVMLFLKTVFYAVFNDVADFFGIGSHGWQALGLPEILLMVLLAGAVIRMYVYCWKKEKDRRTGIFLSALICVLMTADLMIQDWTYASAYEALVNICFIGFSLYKLLSGVKLANLSSVRRYTAALIMYIVLKVSFGDYQLLVKGIAFLMAGLAFLAVNYMMTLKLKGGSSHEGKS